MRRKLRSARRGLRDGRRLECRGGRAGVFPVDGKPVGRPSVTLALLRDGGTEVRETGRRAGSGTLWPWVWFARRALSRLARGCGAGRPFLPPRESVPPWEAGLRACGAEPALEDEDVLPVMIGSLLFDWFRPGRGNLFRCSGAGVAQGEKKCRSSGAVGTVMPLRKIWERRGKAARAPPDCSGVR